MGRRKGDGSKFTQDMADRICEGIASGNSLRRVCLGLGINHATVMDWRRDREDFANQYATARLSQVESLVDEILEISDDSSQDFIETEDGRTVADHEHINRSRLRVDTRKWYASKVAPKLYGEKIHVDQTVQGSLEMFMDSLSGTSLGPPAMRKRGSK
jgi:hypothetical protein